MTQDKTPQSSLIAATLTPSNGLKSESLYRAIFETSPDGITVISLDGRVIAANQRAMQIIGYTTPQEFYARVSSIFSIVAPEDKKRAYENAKRVIESGTVFNSEYRVQHKDGSVHSIEVSDSLIRNADGNPVGIMLITRDIGERKLIQEELLRSEARYRNVIEAMTDLVERFTPDGNITFVNEAYCRFVGKKREELIGNFFISLVPEEEHKGIIEHLARINLAKPVETHENPYILPTGAVHWVHWTDQAIFADDGAIIEYQAVGRDITDRKLAELAEHEQHTLAEALRDTAAALNSTLEIDEVLDRILTNVSRVVPHDAANIMIIEGTRLKVSRLKGYQEQGIDETLLIGADNWQDILGFKVMSQTRKPLVIPNTQTYPDWVILPTTAWIRSYISAPICIKGQVVGFINLDSAKPGFYAESHAEQLMSFADQAAIAIENANLYQLEHQRALQLEALHSATHALVSTLDYQTLLERILTAAASAIPAAQKGSLLLLNPDKTTLIVQASHGYSDPHINTVEFSIKEGYSGKAVRERRPFLVNDVRSDPESQISHSYKETQDILSAVVAPLIMEDEVFGVVSLDSLYSHAFTENDLRLLTSFASTAAAAIHNAQLHANVKELSITDPLTGLYNRRGFFEIGQREFIRVTRNNNKVSIIMADADLLKRVNDTYGHDVGDRFLELIARVCRTHLRKIDVTCRYGGDEFAVILPDTTLPKAIEIAERLRKSVESTLLTTPKGDIQITITLGVATRDNNCQTLEGLLSRADSVLYQAKKGGKNRVFVWDPEQK